MKLPIEFVTFQQPTGEHVVQARFMLTSQITISEFLSQHFDKGKYRQAMALAKEQAEQHVIDELKKIVKELNDERT